MCDKLFVLVVVFVVVVVFPSLSLSLPLSFPLVLAVLVGSVRVVTFVCLARFNLWTALRFLDWIILVLVLVQMWTWMLFIGRVEVGGMTKDDTSP